jgi:malate dehydrogenase (oxaloacetate-decarboxylating)(NADP+)
MSEVELRDAALEPTCGGINLEDTDLLITPNVEAANITYDALRAAACAGITIGGILLGVARPIHIMTRSSTVRRIVNITAVAVAEAGAQ